MAYTSFLKDDKSIQMWETYITDDNIIKISLNVCDMPTHIKFEGDDWDVFNDLCLKASCKRIVPLLRPNLTDVI